MKSLTFFAICTLLILAIGIGCTAPTTSTTKEQTKFYSEDEVVAWVNESPIPKKMLDDTIEQMPPFMKQQYGSPEGLKQLLEKMVDVEIVYQTAKEKGFASRPDIQDKIDQVVKQVVYSEFLKEELEKRSPSPDDAMAKQFYEENTTYFAPKEGGDPKPFEEVKEQIVQHLKMQDQQKVYDVVLGEMKATALVRYNDKVLGVSDNAGAPAHGSKEFPPPPGVPAEKTEPKTEGGE